MLKIFLHYLKPYFWQAVLLVVLIGAQAFATIELPTLMAEIVENGIEKNNMDFVFATSAKMLAFTLFGSVCAVASGLLSARIGTAFSRDLRLDLFEKILTFSTDEIDKFSTASLITRTTNDVSHLQETAMMCLSMLLRAPLMCVGAVVAAIRLAPNMTWIIVLGVVAILVGVAVVLGLALPKFKLFQKMIDKITLLTRENLTGLRVIRAFNNEKVEERKFDSGNRELLHLDVSIGRIFSVESPLISLVMNGICLLCIWIGVSLAEADASYIATMMAFMQYAMHVIMSVLILTVVLVMIPRASVSAGRVNEILRHTPKIKWKKETNREDETKTPEVEFKNVSFCYPNAPENILTDISFRARVGETVAFVGSTGSGKSTLVNLIPRFFDATAGEILVDGINVKDYKKEDLMQKIGYVAQKGVLFSGTVRSNIEFGSGALEKSALDKVANLSQSAEFIEKLPKGFASPIAQGGTNVSGGQNSASPSPAPWRKTPKSSFSTTPSLRST